MQCAIMQPTYLPWAGYLNLIASVEVFVFLDDVQFDRRSWQCRNRIFDGGQVNWLTCPVKKADRSTAIADIQIATENAWQATHAKKIQLNYRNAPYYQDIEPIIEHLLHGRHTHLNDFNQSMIKKLCQLLQINTQLISASSIGAKGKRSSHLLAICEALKVDQYLSPVGSKAYLLEDGVFADSQITLTFQDYTPQTYLQRHSDEFISHLSIIDVIANIGIQRSKEYILGHQI